MVWGYEAGRRRVRGEKRGGRKRSMGQGRMEACGRGSRGLGGRARPICKHAIMIPLLQRNDSVVNFGLRISPPLCWGARGCSCHATWTPPGQLPPQPPAAEHPPVAASSDLLNTVQNLTARKLQFKTILPDTIIYLSSDCKPLDLLLTSNLLIYPFCIYLTPST